MHATAVAAALAIAVALAAPAFAAGRGTEEMPAQFRAKLVKQKAKTNVMQAQSFDFRTETEGEPDDRCGSQTIGQINTNGKAGAMPREVFVFAPNAINLVTGRGCR